LVRTDAAEQGQGIAVRFFENLAALVTRLRWLVIAGWIVVLAAAMTALPSLGSEVNSDPSLFLSSSAPSVQAQTLGQPLLGTRTTSRVTIVAGTLGREAGQYGHRRDHP
jgi:uncharacterized membrane protein YdfJ with MMPL/SSD domain